MKTQSANPAASRGGASAGAAAVAAIAALLWPLAARAHETHGGASGFAGGFLHPVSGLDHVVAMVAVGLWGAQLGPPLLWLLPVAFPMMMAVGGFLGLIGVPLPLVEVAIAASAIVLGTLVAARARPPVVVCVLVVAAFALFHGHAHGAELPPNSDALTYSLGFVVATGLLHGVGILLGAMHQWPAGARVVRAMGLAVAAAGVWFLVSTFRS